MNKDIELRFHKLTNYFRSMLGANGFEKNFTCLLFLKYSMDNRLFTEYDMPDSSKKLESLLQLQSAIFSGYEIIPAVYRYLSDCFGELDFDSFNFAKELYDILEKIAMLDMSKGNKIFRELMSIDLHEFYEFLLELINNLLNNSGRIGMEYSSNQSLVDLAIMLLNPKENDVCIDPFVGGGTFVSSLPGNVKIYGNDINYDALVISTIKCILTGKIKYNNRYSNSVLLSNKDSFSDYNAVKGNCIFSDGPINSKLDQFHLKPELQQSFLRDLKIDSNIASVLNAIDLMEKDGRAIITVPGSTLFNSTKGYKELRKYLVENNLIEAVIELPPLWSATSIQTNILYLSKAKKDNNIVFVSAGSNDYNSFSIKKGSNYSLTEQGIELIVKIINEKIIDGITNVSSVKDREDIAKNDYNLVVNQYVVPVIIKKYRTISEIDNDIKDIWESIKENMRG